jgi:hypothetical protein
LRKKSGVWQAVYRQSGPGYPLFAAPLTPVDQATLYGGDENGYTDYPILTTVSKSSSLANMNRMDSCSTESSEQV